MLVKTTLTAAEQTAWDDKQQARKASFLQSSWWGQFREEYGDKVHYIFDDNWAALVIEMQSPLGMYWLCPYGPTADSKIAMQKACDTLVSSAKKVGAMFLRVEPQQLAFFDSNSFKQAPHAYNPQYTIVNDLTKAEDEIMAGMKQNNRSLVRKAVREGATFERSLDPGAIDLFTSMQQSVVERTGVSFLPVVYYKKQAELFLPTGNMAVEIAYDPGGKPLATALVHDYAGKTTYTYASSFDEARKLDLGRFLVYQSMIAAKKRGQVAYDLFGIAGPNAKSNDPWHGFTFFKKQFGGQEVEFAGTWDKPLNSAKYAAFRLHNTLSHKKKQLKQIKRKKR